MEEIVYFRADKKDIQILVDYRIEFLTELMGPSPNSNDKELRSNLENYFNLSLADDSYICFYAKKMKGSSVLGG